MVKLIQEPANFVSRKFKRLAQPAFRYKVQSAGTEIVGLGQAGFPDYLRQDLQKWKRAVEISGAKVD